MPLPSIFLNRYLLFHISSALLSALTTSLLNSAFLIPPSRTSDSSYLCLLFPSHTISHPPILPCAWIIAIMGSISILGLFPLLWIDISLILHRKDKSYLNLCLSTGLACILGFFCWIIVWLVAIGLGVNVSTNGIIVYGSHRWSTGVGAAFLSALVGLGWFAYAVSCYCFLFTVLFKCFSF